MAKKWNATIIMLNSHHFYGHSCLCPVVNELPQETKHYTKQERDSFSRVLARVACPSHLFRPGYRLKLLPSSPSRQEMSPPCDMSSEHRQAALEH